MRTASEHPRVRDITSGVVYFHTTSTEREYVRRINRVMDHIETNLEQPLPLERLAEVALFSKYHFHRVFFARVGETPGQFIQRLRIEKAARLLLSNRERPVTEVALDCGFSDSAAFARAFRAAFGVSASDYRRRGRAPAGMMPDRNLSTVDGKHSKAAGDEQLFGRLFGTLYQWAGPRDLVKRGVTEEIIIYHDDPETVAPEKLRLSCCCGR